MDIGFDLYDVHRHLYGVLSNNSVPQSSNMKIYRQIKKKMEPDTKDKLMHRLNLRPAHLIPGASLLRT